MRAILLIVAGKPLEGTVKKIKTFFRVVLITWHLALGTIVALLLLWPLSMFRFSFLWNLQGWIVQQWNRILCVILGLKVTMQGERSDSPALLVANHISWLDIVGLLAHGRGVFLAKSEVRHWPVIGWLCDRAGTLFIARGAAGAADRACKQIRNALVLGKNVYIFPEGTSTDGQKVRPFFPRLLEAAIATGVSIQPVALQYKRDGDRDRIAPFVGDDDFTSHLFRVLEQNTTELCINFLPVISTENRERRELAKLARRKIETIVLSDREHPGPSDVDGSLFKATGGEEAT